jgi:hypothetical protein
MFSNEENSFSDAAESQENHSPELHAELNDSPAETQKRNSGRTGPVTPAGRATSARNATVHGMCAKTLITDNEHESDWLALLQTWLEPYQNPAVDSLLYTFVLKTAQAEWFRLRIQREFDGFIITHGAPPISAWSAEKIRQHDLILRYLTTARRTFQSEYRMLEHHWKTHHKPQPEPRKSTKQPDPEPEERVMPEILYVNSETGESVDGKGNHYPPPPDWKPEPIIPGVYPPDHPAGPRPWRK